MIVKIFKGVWFFSLLAAVAVLMYIYASLPESIEVGGGVVLSRSAVFYIALALLTAFNASVFAVSRLSSGSPAFFLVWFYGLIIFLHLLIIVTLEFLNLYNGSEKFRYESIGFIIYGSISLVVLWASLWPLYSIFQKLGSRNPAPHP